MTEAPAELDTAKLYIRLFEPLFIERIVSKIAIIKNKAVRNQVSFDKGFADFVPVPKP